MGAYEGPRIVKDSLSLLLDAGNASSYSGSGTTWYDLSGSGNHGILQAAPTYGSGTFTFTAASSQYVSTTNLFTNPTTNTVGAWFKTSTSNARKIIGFESSQTGTGSASWDRQIYIGSDNKLYCGIVPVSTPVTAVSTNTVTDNIWHYAAMTYGDGNVTLYLDGALQQSTVAANPTNFNGYWRLGSYKINFWPAGGDGYYTGSIAYAHIYNRLLTADEILQNFHALRGRFGV